MSTDIDEWICFSIRNERWAIHQKKKNERWAPYEATLIVNPHESDDWKNKLVCDMRMIIQNYKFREKLFLQKINNYE